METTVENKMKSAFGKESVASDGENLKARLEELEKQLQRERVESGRLKKANEELDALRKENESLKAVRREADVSSVLSDEDKSSVPDEVLTAAAKIARGVEDRMNDRINQKFGELEQIRRGEAEDNMRRTRENAVSRVEKEFPGFLDSVSNGGDKFGAWSEYKSHNAATINSAFESGDFDTLKWHIENFYQNKLHVNVPSEGREAGSAPDPRTIGGGSDLGAVHGKVYTEEEFIGLYDRLEEIRFDADKADERERIRYDIKHARAEGRVKS